MINPNFAIVGAIIFGIGSIPYVLETLQGKVKPNRVTWLIWSIGPLIAFSAQIKQGVGIQSFLTLMYGIVPMIIFAASFVNKKAYWKLGRLDIVCGAFAFLGLILWQITQIGNLAIAFSILADALATFPTLVKSYHEPETENYMLFLTNAISAGITLLTIQVWTFAEYAFPLYIFIMTIILTVLIKFKIGKRI